MKLSVFILNYNYAPYLCAAIDSLLQQSDMDFEFIIIDDGSTDSSAALLKTYEEQFNIKIFYRENVGLIESVRFAYSVLSGDFIMRLDADDWISPDFIKVMRARLSADKGIDILAPDYYEVDGAGNILCSVSWADRDDELSVFDGPAHGACTFVRKSKYFDVGGLSHGISCQDGFDLWLAFLRSGRAARVPVPLFYYRRHGSSITSDPMRVFTERHEIFRCRAYQFGYMTRRNLAAIFIRNDVYLDSAFWLLKFGQYSMSFHAILKSLLSVEITDVLIVSESQEILKCCESEMREYLHSKQVHFFLRSAELAKSNVSVYDNLIHPHCPVNYKDFDNITVVTPNYPMCSYKYIDSSIYARYLYDVDCVPTVFLDKHLSYVLNNGFIEQENNLIFRELNQGSYRRMGGITTFSSSMLDRSLFADARYGIVQIGSSESLEVSNIGDYKILYRVDVEIGGST